MSEEKIEEVAENAENFLEILSMDMDLVMMNFLEISKRIETFDKNALDNDENQLFELGENIGIIKGYMKILNKIYNINKNINKETISEMIKNLDILSSILINLNKNNIDINLQRNLEQRMLTFADSVLEFLEDILRK